MRVIVNNKTWVIVVLAIFIVVFAVIGVVMLTHSKNATQGYVKTKATVVDNYSWYDYSDHEYRYRAIVEYTVDGVKYRATNTAESSNSQYKIGKTVTIAYDPNDPNKVQFVGSQRFFAFMCFVVSGVGVIILIVQIITRVKMQKMISNREDGNSNLIA